VHHLIYTKRNPLTGEIELVCRSFPGRKELLEYALDCGIKLYRGRTLIIGPEGEERGCPDIRAELLDYEKKSAKIASEVKNV